MQTKRSFFTIFMVALAALALVFATTAPSDAGWYKKAKKAAKKAAHKVAENVKAEAKRAADNVSREGKKLGGDISREGKKFAGDVSREGKKFGGDISREGKKFAGDVSREGKKFGGDISRETKRLGRDINRQLVYPGGYMTPYDWVAGLNRLGKNIDNAGTQFNINTGRGSEQLGHNLTQGERHLTHNIDRGVDSLGRNAWPNTFSEGGGPFWAKVMTFGVLGAGTPFTFIFNPAAQDNVFGGIGRLYENVDKGTKRLGDAVSDEGHRVGERVLGSPKVTDLNKSDKDEELPTGKVANALTEKKRKAIDAPESSDTPVAIFRAETDTGIGGSTGGSDTISKERTSTSQGPSTGSSSESSGLGGSQTTGKKESTSTQSTGGPKVGGGPTGRRK